LGSTLFLTITGAAAMVRAHTMSPEATRGMPMSSKTYVGSVTALPRYVGRTQGRGRTTYYYFRRRRSSILQCVRLPDEPGSVPFTTVYNAALKATSQEELMALRKRKQQRRSRWPPSPGAGALWLWANRKPITLAQATMVAELFGVSVDEITRGREIVSD
jgi:hypothetical protein